jgi:hypothetical protein
MNQLNAISFLFHIINVQYAAFSTIQKLFMIFYRAYRTPSKFKIDTWRRAATATSSPIDSQTWWLCMGGLLEYFAAKSGIIKKFFM